ncbi:MAG: bacteriocin [Flavobacterium sp.]|nr:MAG: bacteriocin [Flavobacterium sp.]
MKDLMNVNGAQELSKEQLQTINGGGGAQCSPLTGCSDCNTPSEEFCCKNPNQCP